MMYSFSFFPLITKPACVTGNIATLIDNICCNDVDFPIFSINVKGHIADTKQYITKGILTTKDTSSFQADWNDIMSCSECQQGYSMFHKKYKNV